MAAGAIAKRDAPLGVRKRPPVGQPAAFPNSDRVQKIMARLRRRRLESMKLESMKLLSKPILGAVSARGLVWISHAAR